MIENNPLTQLWEGLGRELSKGVILGEFERAPKMPEETIQERSAAQTEPT